MKVMIYLMIFLFPAIGFAKDKSGLPDNFSLSQTESENNFAVYKKLCGLSKGANYMSTKLSLYGEHNNGDYTPGDMYDKKNYSNLSIKIVWDAKLKRCLIKGSISGIVNGNSRSYNGRCIVHDISYSEADSSYVVTKCLD